MEILELFIILLIVVTLKEIIKNIRTSMVPKIKDFDHNENLACKNV